MPRLATDYTLYIVQQLDLHKILVLKKSTTGTEPEVGLVAAIILSLEEMVK